MVMASWVNKNFMILLSIHYAFYKTPLSNLKAVGALRSAGQAIQCFPNFSDSFGIFLPFFFSYILFTDYTLNLPISILSPDQR